MSTKCLFQAAKLYEISGEPSSMEEFAELLIAMTKGDWGQNEETDPSYRDFTINAMNEIIAYAREASYEENGFSYFLEKINTCFPSWVFIVENTWLIFSRRSFYYVSPFEAVLLDALFKTKCIRDENKPISQILG